MTRIVTPDVDEKEVQAAGLASTVHDYTHGINSDPLTLIGIIFSALVHDVDHRGVSNGQLSKEEPELAVKYNDKSVAEQRSLDLAWDILMADEFAKLRATLFVTRGELLRFRQILVNIVLATDIFDQELNSLRKLRWSKAFGDEKDDHNLRATIVLEHIIQASDVSHTSKCSEALVAKTPQDGASLLTSQFIHPRQCNIGMCTGSGTNASSWVRDAASWLL